MIFSLALKNLTRNKTRTLIIILLMTIILMLLYIGNCLLYESDQGMQKSYTENFTGDAVIMGKSDEDMSLFGANTPSIQDYFKIPVINNTEEIVSYIKKLEPEAQITYQLTGAARFTAGIEKLYSDKSFIFGINPDDYFNIFEYITIEQGKLPEPSQNQIMITRARADEISRETGEEIIPGKHIVFAMYSDTGFKIQIAQISGIFTYNSSNELLNSIILCDPVMVRRLNNITPVTQSLEIEEGDILEMENLDTLFGDSVFSSEDTVQEPMDYTENELEIDYSKGWHFILIKLPKTTNTADFIENFNNLMDENNLELKAVDWRKAAGTSAFMVLFLRFSYNGGFLLVFIAGIITIVNIMVISVNERTKEIGTLRALGSTRLFITKMLSIEILTLTITSGILSVIIGSIIILFINNQGWFIPNTLIRTLLGKQILTLSIPLKIIAQTIGLSLILGICSTILPLVRALKIQPIIAVTKG